VKASGETAVILSGRNVSMATLRAVMGGSGEGPAPQPVA
jgi:hypothetical protein